MNAAAAALVVLNGRQAFDPRASLFSHNEPGFWYDPSDLSSMFQDSAGTTPVTGVEQAVGLILDKIRGLVLGPELVANGSFSSAASWSTPIAGASITGGALTFDGVTSIASGAQVTINTPTAAIVAGRTYLVSYTIISGTTGNVSVAVGNTVTSVQSAAGTYTQYVVATDSSPPDIRTRSSSGIRTGSIDNISVRELAGNHAIQPTAASRPTLRARYNLLTYSEDLSNAAWEPSPPSNSTAVQSTAVSPPPGCATLTLITATAGAGTRLHTGATVIGGQPLVATYRIRAATGTAAQLRLSDGVTGQALITINTATGAITATAAGTYTSVSATSTALGDGWFLYTVNATQPAGQTSARLGVYVTNSGDAIYATGFDVRRSSDTYLPYQRIAAATDYDTVGFPVYLAFDGSDDSLYTGGNVDFSATDKMTVWAGVTKLSDAATAIFAELSADVNANNGSFYIAAPVSAAGNSYTFFNKGTSGASQAITSVASPVTNVVTCVGDISAPLTEIRNNGVAASPVTATLGTGNYGSYPLYIGRRNNASLPFNGRVYALFGRGATTSAALIQQAERWVASKQGRTL